MGTVLWILQGLLALVFLAAGLTKLTQPKEKLYEMSMTWTEDFEAMQIKGIGALEVLGALGLILPALTGIVPILTPIAAAGLATVMFGAAATHMRRKEPPFMVMTLVLGLLALFVSVGRFALVPFV